MDGKTGKKKLAIKRIEPVTTLIINFLPM